MARAAESLRAGSFLDRPDIFPFHGSGCDVRNVPICRPDSAFLFPGGFRRDHTSASSVRPQVRTFHRICDTGILCLAGLAEFPSQIPAEKLAYRHASARLDRGRSGRIWPIRRSRAHRFAHRCINRSLRGSVCCSRCRIV